MLHEGLAGLRPEQPSEILRGASRRLFGRNQSPMPIADAAPSSDLRPEGHR